jgi:hypothetical protein
MFIKPSVLVFIASAIWTAGATAQTATTFTRDFRFPPVGIASTETLQINVVNNAGASSNGAAASCAGTITFTSASGAAIGAATSFTVTSGQIFAASLSFSKAGASGSRAEIVGSVQLIVSTSSPAPCALSSSLETFDTSSGVTHVFLGGSTPQGGGGFGHP